MNRRSFLGAAAAAPFAARASIAHATAGRSRALALVTADAERRVVVVDLASGDVIKRIAVGAGPRSIEAVADGRLAVVGHFNDRLISIIDLRTLRLVGEIGDIGEPRYTAAHRDGRHAHVTDSARGELVTVDLVKRRIVARVEIGAFARHVTIDPSSTRVIAALGSRAPQIAVVDVDDPLHPKLVRRFHAVDAAHDVAAAPDGRLAWISSGATRRVAIHDLATARVLTTVDGGHWPQHIAHLGNLTYVTSGDDGTLTVFETATGRRVRAHGVPDGSYNVVAAAGYIVTPSLDRGTLTTLPPGGRSARVVQAAQHAHDACISIR